MPALCANHLCPLQQTCFAKGRTVLDGAIQHLKRRAQRVSDAGGSQRTIQLLYVYAHGARGTGWFSHHQSKCFLLGGRQIAELRRRFDLPGVSFEVMP